MVEQKLTPQFLFSLRQIFHQKQRQKYDKTGVTFANNVNTPQPHCNVPCVNNPSSDWGGGWGAPREQPQIINLETRKARGDLVYRQGFTKKLPTQLGNKYCAQFLVVGQYFTGCTMKHIVMGGWNPVEENSIYNSL